MTNSMGPAAGDWVATVAEARIRERLHRDEHSPDAGVLSLRLGICLAAQNRDEEACHAFERASQDSEPDVAIRALLQLVRVGSESASAELLERAAERLSAGTHPAAVIDVAAAVLVAGQRLLAVRLLERVLNEAPPPAPRSTEHTEHRRVMAVAALRLGELCADDPDSQEAADELLQRAVDANDPSVTPVAALRLARHRAELLNEDVDERIEELLRVAWAYDHPQASSAAGRWLAEMSESRGQFDRALEFLDALVARGEEKTAAWAFQQSQELRNRPASARDDEYGLRSTIDSVRRFWAEREDIRKLVSSGRQRLTQEINVRRSHGAPLNVERLIRDRVGSSEPHPVSTLIIGAGSGARRLMYEINPQRATIVGLVDDYVTSSVGGHQVLGRIDDLERILTKQKIGQVLLAIPSASPELHYRVGMCCASLGVWLRVLPNPFELLPDRDYVRQLRPLRVEETYGQDAPIIVDSTAGDVVRGKSVLIVGAGGTIGAELARQIIRSRPGHLTLVDRAEASLVRISEELKEERRFAWTFAVLADAINRSEMRAAMQTHTPDVVFVVSGVTDADLAQENLMHTARVNVLGPWICTEEAVRAKSERVVLVSSDNAARRRGPFDWTKALAERAVLSLEAEKTVVCAVRISDVFRTSGSIVARFDRQVHYGGPITINNAAASRRFITLHEAAQWLLRVAAIAEPDAVYAVNAGVEVGILDLAHRVIRLRSLEPDRDVRIAYRNPRRGEMTSQTLWAADEQLLPTPLADVYRIAGDEWDPEEALLELRRVESISEAAPDSVERLLRRSLGLDEPDSS